MNLRSLFCLGFICIVFFATIFEDVKGLLFSQYTLMQVVIAVSWPIPYKNPLRKLFFNIGFQFNYGEPFRLSSFYNATYFQNPFTDRKLETNTDDELTTENSNVDELHEQSRGFGETNERKGSDLTAAQLYESIENNIFDVGYDRSCLLKSICELAQHPLHKEDAEEHLLRDILHFVLTPTEHRGFKKHESYEREKYETAQQIGQNGDDCHVIYSECENSILDRISYLVP